MKQQQAKMLPKEVLSIGGGILQPLPDFLQTYLVGEDIEKDYEIEPKPFARGNFGTVRRVTHKLTGISYAAKFLRRRRRAACWVKQIQHEIAVLLLSVESEQIVKLHAVYETRSEFVLILEMAAGGELQTILDVDGSLTEQKAKTCIREVLKALEFLHRRNVAHLDIKPQNILLKSNNLDDGLKLCDFGFSRAIECKTDVCEIQGTPDYVSPEIVRYEPLSLKSDIWSIGVLTYVLLSGFSPFGSDDKQETFLNITQCNLTFPDDLFSEVSDDAIDFIKSTLRLKPNDRLSVDECFQHKWLSDSSASDDSNDIVEIKLEITPPAATPNIHVEADENTADDVTEEENKENSEVFANQPTMPAAAMNVNVAKVQLEKSLSMSIFPECAPTSPKVSRKALDDDEDDINTQVKEIVKKYQVCEGQPKLMTSTCCESTTSECIICCEQESGLVDIKSTSSIELNKEIAC